MISRRFMIPNSKLTRKHGPNAQQTTGKLRVATAPEDNAIMKNCGKGICGMHPSKLVNKIDSSSEIIIRIIRKYDRIRTRGKHHSKTTAHFGILVLNRKDNRNVLEVLRGILKRDKVVRDEF